MSFYFGFAKEKYSPEKERKIYFEWCGRENYNLLLLIYEAFTRLGKPELVIEGEYYNSYDYKIDVNSLAFIETLYTQLMINQTYTTIIKLCRFKDGFVQKYIDNMSIQEETEYRLSFLIDGADILIEDICLELFESVQYGYDIITALYDGYKDMIKDGVQVVWFYGE